MQHGTVAFCHVTSLACEASVCQSRGWPQRRLLLNCMPMDELLGCAALLCGPLFALVSSNMVCWQVWLWTHKTWQTMLGVMLGGCASPFGCSRQTRCDHTPKVLQERVLRLQVTLCVVCLCFVEQHDAPEQAAPAAMVCLPSLSVETCNRSVLSLIIMIISTLSSIG